MSYRCQICNKTSKVGEKINRVVTKTRKKDYRYWVVVTTTRRKNKTFITTFEKIARQKTNKIIQEFTSKGHEIVEELNLCKECVDGRKQND